MSKKAQILRHLQTKGSITSWEAIKKYEETRLSARILDLRKEGYIIDSIRQQNDETWWTLYVYKTSPLNEIKGVLS